MLQSQNLQAFYKVASRMSFSKAAKELFITQSAISQRIKQLEEQLEVSLFRRKGQQISLTEVGETLLRYCHANTALEGELLEELHGEEPSGHIRVACYSSILRSVIMPSLFSIMKKHRNLHVEFSCHPMQELPHLLTKGHVDFVVLDYEWTSRGVESELLGHEEFVVIESKKYTSPQNVFLDNNPGDQVTENYFKAQKKIFPKYDRLFMSDCYGIIDGVSAGLGRAVMPRHLLKQKKSQISLTKGMNAMKIPICLHYHQENRMRSAIKLIIEQLKVGVEQYLVES